MAFLLIFPLSGTADICVTNSTQPSKNITIFGVYGHILETKTNLKEVKVGPGPGPSRIQCLQYIEGGVLLLAKELSQAISGPNLLSPRVPNDGARYNCSTYKWWDWVSTELYCCDVTDHPCVRKKINKLPPE